MSARVRQEDVLDAEERSESTDGAAASADDDSLVPGWLALLVLVLLLAVFALAGFIIRGLLTEDRVATPAEAAKEQWERAVADDPTDIDALLNLGYAYQQEGSYEEAIRQYDEVLALDARNLAAMYNKGVCLNALGKRNEAEEVLWDVLEIAPDHVLAAKTLGQMYIERKHYKSALATVEPVLQQRPEFADLQYLAGYASEQLGDTETAIERYRAALTYAPDMVEARQGLERLGVTP